MLMQQREKGILFNTHHPVFDHPLLLQLTKVTFIIIHQYIFRTTLFGMNLFEMEQESNYIPSIRDSNFENNALLAINKE